MPNHIIIDGDQATFQPNFGAAIAVVRPGKIRGSGKSSLKGKKVCVAGDEKSVKVPGVMYMTPQFPVPGVGTLKIAALAGNQKAKETKSGKKALILKGVQFQATLEVQTPAQLITAAGTTTDPMSQYAGVGQFVTTNTKYKAS